mgnify:CR=1 FL=1
MSIYKIPLPLNIFNGDDEHLEGIMKGHTTPYPAFVSHFLAAKTLV